MEFKLPLAFDHSLKLALGSVVLLLLIVLFQKDVPSPVLLVLCSVTGFACGLSAGSLLFPPPSTPDQETSKADSES